MKTQQVDDTEFIIRALIKYHPTNDIIVALCEQRGFKWEEAASLVSCIEREHSRSIQARQRPVMIVWSLLMCIGGLSMVTASILSWLNGQLIPLVLTFFIIEVELPYGGQLAGLLLGAGALLGGLAGLWIAVKKNRTDKRAA